MRLVHCVEYGLGRMIAARLDKDMAALINAVAADTALTDTLKKAKESFGAWRQKVADPAFARALQGEPLSECGRERLPVRVEVDIDGKTVIGITAEPSGLWSDGPASVYERIPVAAGSHTITVRLRDSARETGWDYEQTATVDLAPGRYFTITFRAANGGFAFR